LNNKNSSTVLKPEIDVTESRNLNLLLNNQNCGYKDCPGTENSPKIKRPQLSTVYMLCFIYVSLVICSILVIITSLNSYLSNNYSSETKDKNQNEKEKCALLISTVHQLKDKYQLLIIPLTLWLGFSLAFIGADFTKSFVACSLGVDLVGYAMIFFGLTDVIGSYAFGVLFKVNS
jgi:hypothetical protein